MYAHIMTHKYTDVHSILMHLMLHPNVYPLSLASCLLQIHTDDMAKEKAEHIRVETY